MLVFSSLAVSVFLNSQLPIPRNSFNFGKVPFLVAKRTHGSSLEPTLDAIQMKDMTTISKGNTQTIVVGWRGIGLIFNRRFVQGITANGALKNQNKQVSEEHPTNQPVSRAAFLIDLPYPHKCPRTTWLRHSIS